VGYSFPELLGHASVGQASKHIFIIIIIIIIIMSLVTFLFFLEPTAMTAQA
jgi:uncharacterized membrane protein